MRILLTPKLPQSARALASTLVPTGCELTILAASDPAFAAALASANVFMGLPRAKMDAAFFASAPNLQLIQLMRAGHELIDLEAARQANVAVATVGTVTSGVVAEHTLMMMLALTKKLRWQHEAVTTGGWHVAKPWQLPSGDTDSVPEVTFDGLGGRTLGILGLGAIGSRVARLAAAFGMNVQGLAHRDSERDRDGIPLVALPELLGTSDVVSLHLRLTPATRGLMNADAFARMKRGSYFVNTARGELVDETALLQALETGHLAGAALDTLQKEPPSPDHPLLRRADVLLTPHTAWLSRESWYRTLEYSFANISRLRAGEPLQSRVG